MTRPPLFSKSSSSNDCMTKAGVLHLLSFSKAFMKRMHMFWADGKVAASTFWSTAYQTSVVAGPTGACSKQEGEGGGGVCERCGPAQVSSPSRHQDMHLQPLTPSKTCTWSCKESESSKKGLSAARLGDQAVPLWFPGIDPNAWLAAAPFSM